MTALLFGYLRFNYLAMYTNFLIIIVTLFLGNMLQAQQLVPLDEVAYVKQINRTIENTKSDSVRFYNTLLLSEYWAQTDSLKSKQALDKVLSSSPKNTLAKGILEYYQGVFYANQGSKSQAKTYYEQAIKALENDSDNIAFLIKSWYNYAYIQVEDKGYDYMVKTLTEYCIPLSEKSNNTELLAFNYTQLGLTFMSVGQFDTAEEYHKKALEQLNKIKNKNSVHLITYFNLVSNYCYKPDSKTAKIYLDQAKELLNPFPESQYYPNYYYQEAMYYTTIQDFDNALASLSNGAKLAKESYQIKLLHLLYFRMYNVYLMQKDYRKAKAQLEHILAEKVLAKEAVNRRITYTQLAAVNDVLGEYKEAYQWMKKASLLGDSLQQNKLLENMNELEILHQTADKQQKINDLEKEKKANELLSKNKNLRITILVIALILSLVIAFLIFINYKKQQKLNKQISLSHEQDLLHIENQRRYEATQAILQGEEQERQRIAQDLHDSMGGMLANIRMSISSNDSFNKENVIEKLDKSIVEMRRISRNLMPETLKNLGLEIALKELCEAMTQKHFAIQFEAFNLSENTPFKTQMALYRIAQESISNITKYAQATNVIVQISQNNNVLNLTIEDDGIGFDKSEIVYGLGLKNIQNRVQLINGTVEIASNKGEGTTINVECYV
ncbi:tetratricopeptide repeat-containing sensor histidine kinase [Sphingobacterium composti Ten et al. 2007 non Yoo et al. 2007]|uniref:tetratricopeptide repeat-containing sensor histidine kinase n=1 Tax=Sphingobacterium composti TaxID=363260 RepID=UPI001915C462|nr:ATP-binding protein [Sphingobacterium composti Ten et al. 2007 non Yoo et al. 2007]